MRAVEMVRGQATPADLTRVLDALGVDSGTSFLIATIDAKGTDLNEVRRNSLGAFPAEGDAAETARRAALDNYPRSGKQRHECLLAIVDAGERGMTSDEIAAIHGMRLYSVKPRVFELREGGWVERSGTRPSATGSQVDVHVATPKAIEAVAAERGR